MDTGKQETKVRKNLQKNSIQENSNPEKRADTTKNIVRSGKPAHMEMIASSLDNFGIPSKNFRYMESSKEPPITKRIPQETFHIGHS